MDKHQEKSVSELKKLSKRLYRACGQRTPDLAEIQRLIDEGASVNYDTGHFETATPMTAACKKWNRDVIKLLMSNKATVERQFIVKAAEKNDMELIALMTERDFGGYDSTYALHAALKKGHLDIARHLIENGAKLDFRVSHTNKALRYRHGRKKRRRRGNGFRP